MNKFFHCGPFELTLKDGRSIQGSISLNRGELVVLTGPSGSGKTTILRALAGLDLVVCGKRILQEVDYSSAALPLWRSKVVLLAQDAPMLPATLRDNLAFPFRLKHSGTREFDERAAVGLLAKLGVNASLDQDARSLSGGERHRAALARGMLYSPPVLLADEPFSGVDQDTKKACFDILKEHISKNKEAALVVVHDTELFDRADRVLSLKDGRIEAK